MTVSQSQPSPALLGADTKAEPPAAFTPGQHLQAISQAFFSGGGGGWVDPLTWDDYDAEGHAKWEEFAKIIGTNIRASVAAPDLLAALQQAAEKFREYTELHFAKGTVDGDNKAKVNAEMAITCSRAISKALGREAASPADRQTEPRETVNPSKALGTDGAGQ